MPQPNSTCTSKIVALPEPLTRMLSPLIHCDSLGTDSSYDPGSTFSRTTVRVTSVARNHHHGQTRKKTKSSVRRGAGRMRNCGGTHTRANAPARIIKMIWYKPARSEYTVTVSTGQSSTVQEDTTPRPVTITTPHGNASAPPAYRRQRAFERSYPQLSTPLPAAGGTNLPKTRVGQESMHGRVITLPFQLPASLYCSLTLYYYSKKDSVGDGKETPKLHPHTQTIA